MSVEVVTFGCRLNVIESEAIRRGADSALEGDTIVFNTCAVTNEAVRQARQAIRRAAREHPQARIIVTGCAAQIDPQAFAAMPEVSTVMGNADKARPQAWLDLARDGAARVNDIFALPETAHYFVASGLDSAIDSIAGHTRAFVEVQNGCDHRCTFCIIPFGRGPSRSAPAGDVVRQIQTLVDNGYREAVLTGVDITSWGHDLPGTPTLGGLTQQILKLVPNLERLRISSIDCIEADGALLDSLAHEPRLMPHLHLSLQAGDDMILKRMKRRHSRADGLKLIADVRAVRPDTAFGADFIAGFPTETDEMFENTIRLVEEAGLSFLHVFPYSARPGTPAARMPPVKGPVIKARAARLRAAGDAALARHLDRQVGRTLDGLVESDGRARAADFTEVIFEGEARVGAIAGLRVTGHDGRRALAAVI